MTNTKTENFIVQAASHLKDVQNRTMTTDRLVGAYITFQQIRIKQVNEDNALIGRSLAAGMLFVCQTLYYA
ncbi:hypothetical protein ACQKNB_23370 [Lysinibacillus xylanilyticus]|uniref:hypothetical protein n=1 Tax=Lysinibacillus xylanilyticus TaxID=582475 RepID=UPI003D030C8C